MNEENKTNLPVVEITNDASLKSYGKQQSDLQLPTSHDKELTLKLTKSTDKPPEKKHNKSTLE